jgi:UDP-N-acetylmuramate dehydrogenase
MASGTYLKDYAYYRTGGACRHLHHPDSSEQLAAIRQQIATSGEPYFVLGGGSNSLVMDDDWPGHVIVFDRMQHLELGDQHRLYVDAGVTNTAVARFAHQHGLAGVAWMNRLPGELGGTVRMNARCYGGEISQVVCWLKTVTIDGQIKHYQQTPGERTLFRGYKDTVFMMNTEIIARVGFQLQPGDPQRIAEWMTHCEQDRLSKNQFDYPSCGCVFKNNYEVGVPSGMLLDQAGVHKLSDDKVRINPKHANFVFNVNASSRDILETTFAMREKVYQQFGVWLEYEMEVLGQMPADLSRRFREQRPMQLNESALEPLRQAFRQGSRS